MINNCLVIGVDGLEIDIIEQFNLKNLKSVIEQNQLIPIHEDLFSRGWVEILTGKTGIETGAFYKYPVFEGSYLTTGSYNATDLMKHDPIWVHLNKKGISTGIFNVPTTYPSNNAIDGFCISGAGAGSVLDGASEIDLNAVSDPEIASVLRENGYFPDVRFTKGGYKNSNEYLKQVALLDRVHAKSFVNLVEKYNTQFNFIAFMSPTRINNIYRWCIENWNKSDPTSQVSIANAFKSLDDEVGFLIKSLNPKHIFIVSDHGCTGKKYILDINNFLLSKGFSANRISKDARSTIQQSRKIRLFLSIFPIARKFKKALPLFLARYLRKGTSDEARINYSKSLAFGFRYIPGIYLNDERFDGLCLDNAKFCELIIDAVNTDEKFSQLGIKARINPERKANTKYSALVPDIWLDLPLGVFPEQIMDSEMYIIDCPTYNYEADFSKIKSDFHAGVKSPFAILSVPRGISNSSYYEKSSSLTSAFDYFVKWSNNK